MKKLMMVLNVAIAFWTVDAFAGDVRDLTQTPEYQSSKRGPEDTSQVKRDVKPVYREISAPPKGISTSTFGQKSEKSEFRNGVQADTLNAAPVYKNINKEPADVAALKKQHGVSLDGQKQAQSEYKKISEPPAGMKVSEPSATDSK